MSEEIIGHGTWYDKTAVKILERERKLGRNLNLVRTEMGFGASGIPHVGNISDAVRSYAISIALQDQGYNSELIAFCDDKDGLRKVPAGLPKSLNKYLGFPVSSIPDPYGCHKSFGEHSSLLLLEALDKCGLKYTYMSASEVYKRGLLNNEIKTILLSAKGVGEIIKREVGQEKFEEVLPYFAVCSNCGRIYTTKAHDFLPKENKILYSCEGMKIKHQWFKGCGHKDEADFTKGEGKLAWKVEFAARWKFFDIRFEAYGKDIADSVRLNDSICLEILDWSPPLHAQYELFLAKEGKKFSKSSGAVFTPQVWFRYGSPESLNLLMLKRFVGTRAISVTDIPVYMNEFDDLEDIYFGNKKIANAMELAKLRGLYEYLRWLKTPEKPSIHVPYNVLAYITKIAPKGSENEYILQKLKEYGYTKGEETSTPNLKERIGYALNWTRDFTEIKETAIKLSDLEKEGIKDFILHLRSETQDDAERIQGIIFETARKNSIPPSRFFRILYTILLGSSTGPRMGPYIISMGKDNVIDALERTIKKT